jgi:hypothetical protein
MNIIKVEWINKENLIAQVTEKTKNKKGVIKYLIKCNYSLPRNTCSCSVCSFYNGRCNIKKIDDLYCENIMKNPVMREWALKEQISRIIPIENENKI